MQSLKNILVSMRVHQWHKNLLVLAPLVFSGAILNTVLLQRSLLGFVAFCFTASAVYLMNDILDRKHDLDHPEKQHRPIASGKLPVALALGSAVLLLAASAAMVWKLPVDFAITLLAYLLINIVYSLKLKQVAVWDVLLVASMYLLRVIAGTEVLEVATSNWLLLCTFFLALFLVLGKRRAELLTGHGAASRHVLKVYNISFIEHALSISIVMSIMTYALYTVFTAKNYLLYSTFFVVFVLFRYMFLIYKEEQAEKPEVLLLQDKQILLTTLAWFVYMVFVYYGNAVF